MMHISMIFDPDARICDAGFFPDQRTNEQADSRSWMHVSRMYVFRIYVSEMRDFSGPTDKRTDGPILGVGCCVPYNEYQDMLYFIS